jgi:phosphotriesterase-related protein
MRSSIAQRSTSASDVRFGLEVARKSGMHLVVSTGQHFFAPEELGARSVEEITDVFIREINKGIDDTDIKAGAIKVAARSEAMTPAEIIVFRAAARAHKATGVPIQTHTNARRRAGERQVEIFEAEGVSPDRVSLGHSDDTEDLDYLLGLARRGYTLGMDHAFYGMVPNAAVSFQRRVEYIKKLVDEGFINRILLSTDWELGERERLNPDGLLFVTGRTIPYLKQLGFLEQQVRAITVQNPARFFTRGK